MKIRPEELDDNDYILLEKLDHKELILFVRTYLKKRTKYAMFYYFANLILFGLLVFLFLKNYHLPDYSIANQLNHLSYGIALSFVLLPFHEYIHVLAYKTQGAENTSYDANFKKFYFMALADRFVANKKEFEVVALSPFIIISTILIILYFNVDSDWDLTISGILLAHTAMCSGDFGLLSYFEYNKEKKVVTYDDIKNKISYFYGQINK